MLKKIFTGFMFLIFFINFSEIYAAEILGYTNDKSITLEDSIKLALLNNRNLIVANEEISMIKYKTDEALAYRYTQLDLLANYSHYKLENPYYIISNSADNFLLDKNKENQHAIRFNLSQILYSGRRSSNTKKSSDVSLKKAKSEFETIKNSVIFNTKLAFYQYLFDTQQLDILLTTKNYIDKLIQIKTNSGFVFSDDEEQAFQGFYNNFLFKIDALNMDRTISKLNFFNVIGVEQNSLLEINGVFSPLKPIEKDMDTCIVKALYLRPELLASEALEELGFLEVNISLAEKNPLISFNASYQYASDVLNLQKDNWSADWHLGLNMNIPIFDGGTWIARNNQKKINLRKLKVKRAENEENIKLEVRTAYMRYELANKKLEMDSKYFDSDKKNLKIVYDKIDSGKIVDKLDWLFCLEVLKRDFDINNRKLEDVFDYNKKNLKVHFVMGDIS